MTQQIELSDVHWMMDALQSIEVGLLVVDADYNIVTWNGFMEHHSGIRSSDALGQNLLELSPDLPVEWLQRQLEAVSTLRIPVYSTWKQRSYLFRFKSYRPITGQSEFMFQNIAFLPLSSVNSRRGNICITLYDVTQNAVSEQAMNKLNDELAYLSRIDRMTELYNRGHWEEMAQREFKRCQRYGHTSTLVMFDIDHFKNVNDTYGHQVGDEVIKALAHEIREAVRESDLAGRYGGEEFTVVLSDTADDGAAIFCERVRKTVEDMTVEALGESVKFTLSLGYSEITAETPSLEVWLKQADAALYYAKEHGRNQVVRFEADKIAI